MRDMESYKHLEDIQENSQDGPPSSKRFKRDPEDSEADSEIVANVNKPSSEEKDEHSNVPDNKIIQPITSKQEDVTHNEQSRSFTSSSPSDIDVDLVIYNLSLPPCGAEVAYVHCNAKTANIQVKAYAKLAGRGWTFYVQTLPIIIGRKSGDPDEQVDIDLAPSKVISRKHAIIQYNLTKKEWEVVTVGRNGLKIDGNLIKVGETSRLYSGQVLEIGGVQMMFVSPEKQPVVSSIYIQKAIENQKARLARQNAELLSAAVNASSYGIPANGAAAVPPGLNVPSAMISRTPSGIIDSRHPVPASDSKSINGMDMSSRKNGIKIGANHHIPVNHLVDCDLSLEEAKDIKPPYSYATMITQAIMSSPDHMMSLAGIYAWISEHYAFYRRSKPGWQNSIRHNLSLNKAFEKVARKQNEPGKGSKWHIVDKYKDDLIRKATNARLTRNFYAKRGIDETNPQHPKYGGYVIQYGDGQHAMTSQGSTPNDVAYNGMESPGVGGLSPGKEPTQRDENVGESKESSVDAESNIGTRRDSDKFEKQQKSQEERHILELRRREEQEIREGRGDGTQRNQRAPRSSKAAIANRAKQIQDMQNLSQPSVPYPPPGQYGSNGAVFSPQHQPMNLNTTPHQRQPYPVYADNPQQFQMQGFQYMQAFGLPYYNNLGQQPPAMMQQMPMYNGQNHASNNAPLASGPHLPPPPPNRDQVASPTKQHRANADENQQHPPPPVQPVTQDGSIGGSSDDETTLNRKLSETEFKTPAKSLTRSPQLDSAVKLEISQVSGAPESSPALWRYMNLESTPNNHNTTVKGNHERGAPESSPPRELPMLKSLENSRV